MTRKRHFILWAGVAALVALVVLPRKPAVPWEPWMETGKDVYPSLLLATAKVDWRLEDGEADSPEEDTVGDRHGWFGVHLRNVPKDTRISVEISGEGWVSPSHEELVLPKAMHDVYVQPKMLYNQEFLRTCRAQKTVNLTFKVGLNGTALPPRTETLLMHDLNDCPYALEGGDDTDSTDLSWMFAAYVDENHPALEAVIQEALSLRLVDRFSGYESENRDAVITEVFALWQALEKRGIQYSDAPDNTGSKLVYSQRVRFPDETLTSHKANCVDGSVLMASLLRRIGINAYLVIIPDHCIVAFDLDKGGQEKMALETTLLGEKEPDAVKQPLHLPDTANRAVFEKARKTFQSAIAAGNEEMQKSAAKFADEEDLDYQLISIQEERDFGITPLLTGAAAAGASPIPPP